ncbi:MAG TPA: pyrimidine-nucleoside phosphorylase, partial [Acholeplasmataceae bacterium]|nr:pyrimidine-nucleoside phosphorylase [Acholeplasmataceae bacterium]
KKVIEIRSPKKGYVKKVKALAIGNAAMLLGAGRATKDDVIDLSVGVEVLAKVGDRLDAGDLLAIVHGNEKNLDEAVEMVKEAFEIVEEEISPNKLILDIVR